MSRKILTPQQREAARATRAAKVEQMYTALTGAVGALTSSGQWQRWLNFHRYSFNNTLLILIQCPEASQVAGFKAWQSKGRQVRKGEKGIRIFGKPFRILTQEDETTGEMTRTTVPMPPPVVTVFDISQTDPIEGAEQPLNPVTDFDGHDHAGIYARLSDWMTTQGWTITRETIAGARHGYCTVDGTRRIVVDATLSDAQAAKTMIHETTHALLHTDDTVTRELEAESVAYVLAGLHGFDTSTYSVGYLAGWSHGDVAKLKATAVRVQETVRTLAEVLDPTDKLDPT